VLLSGSGYEWERPSVFKKRLRDNKGNSSMCRFIGTNPYDLRIGARKPAKVVAFVS
jgi:hypothetical protein